MIVDRGSLMGRAYTALAICYAVACCLPACLAQMMNASEIGSMPGYAAGVNGRLESCEGDFGCPTEPADIVEVLFITTLVLTPSLLAAVPLCTYLARKWQLPILAGLIAAVLGWAVLCVGGLLFFVARAHQ